MGSNGWALGKDKSEGGRGMVVANPHFPWEGELKLWESHLTVPGQLNIYGVGLLGVPAVLIGFNENVAWTHTFSYGQRMTLYRLPLVEGKPTTYKYDGAEREIIASRTKGWVDAKDLAEVNRLLGRALQLLHKPRSGARDKLIAVTVVMAPLPVKPSRRGQDED